MNLSRIEELFGETSGGQVKEIKGNHSLSQVFASLQLRISHTAE